MPATGIVSMLTNTGRSCYMAFEYHSVFTAILTLFYFVSSCVTDTHTHTVRRHLCHARRIYLKVKRSFTQRKWGRLRCPVPSSPSQRQHQHQSTRTDRRWLAEVQTPHRPAAPGRLVRSSDGDVNRFTPHRPAALRAVFFLTERPGTLVVELFFISIDSTAA